MADPGSLLRLAFKCRCPRCGEGKLYDGLLALAPACPACGLDLAAADAGDGPAVLVVFLLGAVVVALAILLELLVAPPLVVHVVLWTPAIVGGAILMLRPLKAGLIARQYRHRAAE